STWSVTILDLDHFSIINEAYGTITGDSIIQLLAGILQERTNSTDSIMRIDDDEFLVVQPDTSAEDAVKMGQSIVEDISVASFPRSLSVSVSIGLAQSDASVSSLEELLDMARKAVRRAKQGGRGRIAIYDESLSSEAGPVFDYFVNRQTEMDKLRRALDSSFEGNAETAAIFGEAGVGKSTLLREMSDYAVDLGFLHIPIDSDPVMVESVYILLLNSLNRAVLELTQEVRYSVYKTVEDYPDELLYLFPWTGEQIDIPLQEQEQEESMVLSLICDIIKAISRINPVLLTIEDLHLLPGDYLKTVAFIVRNFVGNGVMSVLTGRTCQQKDEISMFLSSLSGFVDLTYIKLTGLTREFTTHMVTLALRNPEISNDSLGLLHSSTKGNPLYIEELLSKLHEDGSIGSDEHGRIKILAPSESLGEGDLSDVIMTRLQSLDPQVLLILQYGALVRKNFSMQLLTEVTRIEILKLAGILDSGMAAGLIKEVSEGAGKTMYTVSHDLLKELVLTNLSKAQRNLMHRKLAAFYEQLVAEGDDSCVIDTAHHFNQTDNIEKKRHFTLLAARRYRAVKSEQDELYWLKQYILSLDGKIKNDENAFEVLTRLGRLHSLIGDVSKGYDHLSTALELELDDDQKGTVYFLLASNSFNRGELDEAESYWDKCSRYSLPSVTRINVLAKMGFYKLREGKIDEAKQYLSELRTIEIENENEEARLGAISQALSLEGIILTYEGELEKAGEAFEAAIELKEQMRGNSVSLCMVLNNLACNYLERGYVDRGLKYLAKAEDMIRSLGGSSSLANIYTNYASTYYEIGHFDKAAEYANRCLDLCQKAGLANAIPHALYVLAKVCRVKSDSEGEIEYLIKMLENSERTHHRSMITVSLYSLALAHIRAGRIEKAREYESQVINDARVERPVFHVIRALLIQPSKENNEERLMLMKKAWEAVRNSRTADCINIASEYMKELMRQGLVDKARELKHEMNHKIMDEADRLEEQDTRSTFEMQPIFRKFRE
ncbi:MAG: diguanylate cyclase, partial [Candidatus Aegiribacteria sp.]|nr:diguanylate cyclase [Candidatus Aegiribacteria sp.]